MGSVRAVLDGAGAVQSTTSYDPWGVPTAGSVDPFGFTGELHDGDLVHLRARWYHPSIGTFTSRDPFAGFDTLPYSLHPYQYAYSNPVLWTDPSGRCVGWIWDDPTCEFIGWDRVQEGDLNWEEGRPWGGAALDFIPVVGDVKGLIEVFTGCDLVTGEDLGHWRWAGLLFMSELRSVRHLDAVVTHADDVRHIPPHQGMSAGGARSDMAPEARTRVDELCFNSFSAETLVSTEDGLRPISEIAIGDRVWAYDEATDEHGLFPVTDVIIHTDPTQVHLLLDGELLETTPEHPFYTLERGWVDAGDLWVGAHIRQADGSYGRVQFLAVEREDQVLYNLTVAEAHTFFVGAQRWLVHNTCPPGGYKRWDVDRHGDLNNTDIYPLGNRAPGYSSRPADNQIQSHHVIQNEGALAQRRAGRPGFTNYKTDDATAILLESTRGHEHAIITGQQTIARNQRLRQGIGRWDSSYGEGLTSAYKNLRTAGVPHNVAWNAVKKAHQYFLDLEVPANMYRP